MGERWTPTLEDYIDIAAALLGTSPETVRQLPRITLAESAIHAPFASFGGQEAYPDLIEQATVLLVHLARNHPLPDANKRAAFVMAARFLEANGRTWKPQDIDSDAGMVESVAAGEADHHEISAWITARTTTS